MNFKSPEVADFRLDLKTDNAEINILPMIVSPLVGSMIADKVQGVTVKFQEDGIFTFSWRPVGTNADVTLIDIVKSIPQMSAIVEVIEKLLVFQYYTKEGDLFIVLDKQMIALLGAMKEMIPVDIEAILTGMLKSGALLDQGTYYILPLTTSVEEGVMVFKADKRLTIPVVNIIPGILDLDLNNLPPALEPYDTLIEAALTALPAAEKFDIGLGFLMQQSIDF